MKAYNHDPGAEAAGGRAAAEVVARPIRRARLGTASRSRNDVRDSGHTEKYRYLYDARELEEWLALVLELAEEADRVHVVFNNCYANYGTTNAIEMAGLLSDPSGGDLAGGHPDRIT